MSVFFFNCIDIFKNYKLYLWKINACAWWKYREILKYHVDEKVCLYITYNRTEFIFDYIDHFTWGHKITYLHGIQIMMNKIGESHNTKIKLHGMYYNLYYSTCCVNLVDVFGKCFDSMSRNVMCCSHIKFFNAYNRIWRSRD